MKTELAKQLEEVSKNQINGEDDFDIYAELEKVLSQAGLSAKDAGGKVSFYSMDPIVKSNIRLGAGSSIGLMGKAIAAAKIWKLRTGKGQDLKVNLAQGLERLGVQYSALERVNGYYSDIPDPNLLGLINFLKQRIIVS
jgi:hypothetical protein